ncbi:MAG: HEPN domain-containing protein [Dehalococcoidia bacterium]|nr:HEPN domain-containing protein [Dehalococcoidia bacterium]
MTTAPDITLINVNQGHDPRAVSVAQAVHDLIDAECVILFGSRSREGWSDRSDIDIMVITEEPPTQTDESRIAASAEKILGRTYAESPAIDLVLLSTKQYSRRSKSINNVAAIASREGIKLTRNPEENIGHEFDAAAEREDRIRRIADANMHYRNLNLMLDAGVQDRGVVFQAHQALENGMKALISALGNQYPHRHDLTELADAIRQSDSEGDWHFQSDLRQLSGYPGAARYGQVLNPVTDFVRMANDITSDLEQLHQRILELTGDDPWAIPPETDSDPVRPRHRS